MKPPIRRYATGYLWRGQFSDAYVKCVQNKQRNCRFSFQGIGQLNNEDDTDGDDDDDKVVKRLYFLLTYLAMFKFAD